MNKEKQIISLLDEVMKESLELNISDSDVIAIPEQAYNETLDLFKKIPECVEIPLMMSLDAGGIGLQWNYQNGIITMSLYGDNKLNFVYIFKDKDKDEIAATVSLNSNALIQVLLALLI